MSIEQHEAAWQRGPLNHRTPEALLPQGLWRSQQREKYGLIAMWQEDEAVRRDK